MIENQLILEKVLFYHRRNQEQIGQVELAKQKRINSANLLRNCILTEITNLSRQVNTFIQTENHRTLYPEDKEFLTITLSNYINQAIRQCDQERKGYDH